MQETCENCGRVIGNLEEANLHNEQIVCAKCYEQLAQAGRLAMAAGEYFGSENRNRCPKCASNQTASLAVIYQQGSRLSDWGGSQTLFSAIAGPPRKRHLSGPISLFIISSVFAIGLVLNAFFSDAEVHSYRDSGFSGTATENVFSSHSGQFVFALIGIVVAIVSVSLIIKSKKYNQSEWPVRYTDWKLKWKCKSCGAIFKNVGAGNPRRVE